MCQHLSYSYIKCVKNGQKNSKILFRFKNHLVEPNVEHTALKVCYNITQ